MYSNLVIMRSSLDRPMTIVQNYIYGYCFNHEDPVSCSTSVHNRFVLFYCMSLNIMIGCIIEHANTDECTAEHKADCNNTSDCSDNKNVHNESCDSHVKGKDENIEDVTEQVSQYICTSCTCRHNNY